MWVDLVAATDVASGTARRVEVEGRALCVANCEGEYHVVDDTCSHEDFSLSEGQVFADFCEVECPKHASSFDLRTGEPTCLPATRPVRVYPARVADGRVEADLG
jgi:3-phenylpropionate/trans-cinnamate dioxygenase ferredoxin subunit